MYAFADKDDACHLDARAIMLFILRGDLGSPIVLDYVLVETLLLLNARKLSNIAVSLLEFLRANKFRIFFVTEEIFNDGVKLMMEKHDSSLSLADSTQIVFSKSLEYCTIATFDNVLGNFFESSAGKGSFDQLDPREKRALMKRRL